MVKIIRLPQHVPGHTDGYARCSALFATHTMFRRGRWRVARASCHGNNNGHSRSLHPPRSAVRPRSPAPQTREFHRYIDAHRLNRMFESPLKAGLFKGVVGSRVQSGRRRVSGVRHRPYAYLQRPLRPGPVNMEFNIYMAQAGRPAGSGSGCTPTHDAPPPPHTTSTPLTPPPQHHISHEQMPQPHR